MVKSWVWDEVYQVYFQDKHGIGVDEFLEQDHNVHVKTHMQAITLVAAHRDYWKAPDKVIRKQAREFAQLVAEHGLPGGGHTRPDHPTMDWVAQKLDDPELKAEFNQVRAAARTKDEPSQNKDPSTIAEIRKTQPSGQQDQAQKTSEQKTEPEQQKQTKQNQKQKQKQQEGESSAEGARALLPWLIAALALLLLAGGIYTGRRT